MDKRITVLVIDDEPAILRLVSLALQDSGMGVLAAPDGETASDLLESQQPDLIVSDVRLPGMDGLEIARRVKRNPALSTIPVLLISAFGEPQGHQADAFLAKPFDIEHLVDRMNQLLDAAHANI